LTFKKTGIKAFQFNKEDNTINYAGKVYRIISLMTFLVISFNAFLPKTIIYFVPIDYIVSESVRWIGLFIIHLSFVWIFIAQRNMATEWRIGIDKVNKVRLITKGLFSISRNPIFFGVILVFSGLFFMLPNVVTAVILVSGYIVIQVQVRLEEEFLLKELGDEYILYKNKVKRWIYYKQK